MLPLNLIAWGALHTATAKFYFAKDGLAGNSPNFPTTKVLQWVKPGGECMGAGVEDYWVKPGD